MGVITLSGVALFVAASMAFGQQPAQRTAGTPRREPRRESDSTFIARERAAWDALKNADSAAFVRALGFSPSILIVNAGVLRTSAAQIATDVTKCDTRSSKLDMFTVSHPADDTAILAYRVSLDRRCGHAVGRGFDLIALQEMVMTVWVRRNGRWEAVAQSLTSSSRNSTEK